MPNVSMHDFIAQYGITSNAVRMQSRPQLGEGWGPNARHWQVTLTNPRGFHRCDFTQGSAHTKAPTTAEVLDCLRMDALAALTTSTVADFAADFGYDMDDDKEAIRVQRIYRACVATLRALRKWLGDEATNELLSDVEGL